MDETKNEWSDTRPHIETVFAESATALNFALKSDLKDTSVDFKAQLDALQNEFEVSSINKGFKTKMESRKRANCFYNRKEE